jgi:hypothetical protein
VITQPISVNGMAVGMLPASMATCDIEATRLMANLRACYLDRQLAPDAATPGQLAQTRERYLTLRFSFREPARG